MATTATATTAATGTARRTGLRGSRAVLEQQRDNFARLAAATNATAANPNLARMAQSLTTGTNYFDNFNPYFGTPVIRDAKNHVAADIVGKNMGFGTFANAGKNFFNTKESVLMVPAWANALNLLHQVMVKSGVVQQAIANGIRDFSLGISGVLPDNTYGYYVPGITQYYPDDRARITISGIRDPNGVLDQNIQPYHLPGSTAARAANANGLAIGLAYVRNPAKQTGYLRLGSKGWLNALTEFVDGTGRGTREGYEHLFGQGAVYGLGPVYAAQQINVEPEIEREDFPVRFKVVDNVPFQDRIRQPQFRRQITGFYNLYLKNPDQMRLGQYGAGNLFLRHADKVSARAHGDALGNNPDALLAFNNQLQAYFDQNGTVAGLAHWGKGREENQVVDYALQGNRRGLTARPLRLPNGQAVPRSQSYLRNAGECNVYGGGVGVSQRAQFGGEGGDYFYKTARGHRSTTKNNAGSKTGRTTWHCGPTPDYVINPDRLVYQRGSVRTAPDASLEDVLAEFQNQEGLGLDANSYRRKYSTWTAAPDQFGTDQYFMAPPSTKRRGFLRANPTIFSNLIQDPATRDRFIASNLTYDQKALRSMQAEVDAVAAAAQQPPPVFAISAGKTSPPTANFPISTFSGEAWDNVAAMGKAQGGFRPQGMRAGAGSAAAVAR